MSNQNKIINLQEKINELNYVDKQLDAQIAEYIKVDDPESKQRALELTHKKNQINHEIN